MQREKLPARWTPSSAGAWAAPPGPTSSSTSPSGNEGLIDITSQRRTSSVGRARGPRARPSCTSPRPGSVDPRGPSAAHPQGDQGRRDRRQGARRDAGLGGRAAQEPEGAAGRRLREARKMAPATAGIAAFIHQAFEGGERAAEGWMRERGIANYKGMPGRKARTVSAETRAKRKKLAAKTASSRPKPRSPPRPGPPGSAKAVAPSRPRR